MVVPVAPQVAAPNSVLLDQPRGSAGITTHSGGHDCSSVTTRSDCQRSGPNLLLDGIHVVEHFVEAYRDKARAFYHEVILSLYECTSCGGKLKMTGPSRAKCVACGQEIDPTKVFQRSPCCSTSLRLEVSHYSCSHCRQRIPSRFLFDEQVFDSEYFREKMRESRERKALKQEAILRRLATAHSDELDLLELIDPILPPDLLTDLDSFAQGGEDLTVETMNDRPFNQEGYRQIIFSTLQHQPIWFDELPHVDLDDRLDRIWRFIVLIQMEHFREVWLEQRGNDIQVMRYEAHCEG